MPWPTDFHESLKFAAPFVDRLATMPNASETLNARQQAIVPIAAFATAGDTAKLNVALNQGLDSGMTVSDAREILVQLYAYAGFPRSLNALSELMKVLEARKQRGIQDAPGRAPTRPGRRAPVRLRARRKRIPAQPCASA